ncbi:MAG: toll/interleukin-1 receptor domain-containing protein [Rivularia sp. (in: cyanobacteria)]
MSPPPQSEYDVFLCHNSKDKPEVREIGQQLKQQGLKPWLDEWELRPGLSLMEQLEETIKKIKSKNLKSAAVFIGNNGLGPWQKKEIEVFLNLSTTNKYPLIPVLLSTAPQGAESEFSSFLTTNLWVDFRHQQPEPMCQLFWAITGIKLQNYHAPNTPITKENNPTNSSTSVLSATLCLSQGKVRRDYE